MIRLTVAGLLDLRPCSVWTRERLEGLFGDREAVTLEEAVLDERVPLADAAWLVTRLLPAVGVRFAAVAARWACLRAGWRDPRSARACRSAYAGEMSAAIRDDAGAAARAAVNAAAASTDVAAAARAADAALAAAAAAHSADADAHVSYAVGIIAEDVVAADANAALRARMVGEKSKRGLTAHRRVATL